MYSNRYFTVLACMHFMVQHFTIFGEYPTASVLARYMDMTRAGIRKAMKKAEGVGLVWYVNLGMTWDGKMVKGYRPDDKRYEILKNACRNQAEKVIESRLQ